MDEIETVKQIAESSLPQTWQQWTVAAFAISLIVGRVYKAIVNGGGLKSILASVWLGTNQPTKKNES